MLQPAWLEPSHRQEGPCCCLSLLTADLSYPQALRATAVTTLGYFPITQSSRESWQGSSRPSRVKPFLITSSSLRTDLPACTLLIRRARTRRHMLILTTDSLGKASERCSGSLCPRADPEETIIPCYREITKIHHQHSCKVFPLGLLSSLGEGSLSVLACSLAVPIVRTSNVSCNIQGQHRSAKYRASQRDQKILQCDQLH